MMGPRVNWRDCRNLTFTFFPIFATSFPYQFLSGLELTKFFEKTLTKMVTISGLKKTRAVTAAKRPANTDYSGKNCIDQHGAVSK